MFPIPKIECTFKKIMSIRYVKNVEMNEWSSRWMPYACDRHYNNTHHSTNNQTHSHKSYQHLLFAHPSNSVSMSLDVVFSLLFLFSYRNSKSPKKLNRAKEYKNMLVRYVTWHWHISSNLIKFKTRTNKMSQRTRHIIQIWKKRRNEVYKLWL